MTKPEDTTHDVGAPFERGVRPPCSHCGFPLPANDSGLRHYGTHTAHRENDCLRLLQAEIARLTAALKAANDQAEHFERGWYLRGDVLEKLQNWADAYPLKVFPEPDMVRAHELLTAGGMTLDSISASNMRHVIDGVRKLVAEGLAA